MLTVTTFQDGQPGFALFLDGVLRGLINAGSTRSDAADPADSVIQVQGGRGLMPGCF